MAGRPHNWFKQPKHRKSYMDAGRYEKRLARLHAKREKLEMMETILLMHEQKRIPDNDYIRGLKRRANEVHGQLTVLSTRETMERV